MVPVRYAVRIFDRPTVIRLGDHSPEVIVMNLIKVCGLTALAVVAVMAFSGTDTAAAQKHGVALCKVLEKLCAVGNLWPKGTVILALAKEPKLNGVLPITCEDSTIQAVTLAQTASPLPIEITSAEYGRLPTPSLGNGCTGCPFGLKTEAHTAPFAPFPAQLTVEGEDEYRLLAENLKFVVLCGSVKCGFEAKHVKSLVISHNGTHSSHPNATNLPSGSSETTLTVYEDTSGIGICGSTAKCLTTYTVYLAHFQGASGLVWPSLDAEP